LAGWVGGNACANAFFEAAKTAHIARCTIRLQGVFMRRVTFYSVLLVVGMGLSQLAVFQNFSAAIAALTMIFLAYIMIEVGMEFDIDKSRLGTYLADYGIAMGAAAIPWACAALYFWWWFGLGFKESLLVGRFASPTSAGILFTMLAAAGLAATWLYKKAAYWQSSMISTPCC
jgi:Kef-type K+ transport system membrane component KefB